MIEFKENTEFEIKNLISYREIVKQNDSISVYEKLMYFVKENNVNIKEGFSISALHNVLNKNGELLLDTELIWMTDEPVEANGGVKYLPNFKIENALKMMFSGSQDDLSKVDNLIYNYIKKNNLIPLTPCYMVTEMKSINENDDNNIKTSVCFYMGIEESNI